TAQWLHVSGYLLFTHAGRTAFAEAIDRAQQASVPVSVDVGIGAALAGHRGQLRERLTAIDMLLADEAELAIVTGEDDPETATRIARAKGTRAVIVKRGAAGCRAATDDDEWTLRAPEVDPVDATGAGDAFSAGVIAGRLGGLDWRPAVWLANALGGLSVRCHGAGRALPDRAQLINAIQAQAPSDNGSPGTAELASLIEQLGNPHGNQRG
ncbi:MAG: carbohydrate kinase family protein, partial [Candidatus Bipolaricaulia bacterium]